jgi:hypothetical protein
MTRDELTAAQGLLGTQVDQDGMVGMKDEVTMALHVARDGALMTISRVAGFKVEGTLMLAKTAKKELSVFALADLLSISTESATGPSARRPAGF